MSNPLQNDPPKRRSDQAKVMAILDLAKIIVDALFAIFGRRKEDRQ